MIEEAPIELKTYSHKYRSDDISQLVGSLAKAQGGYQQLIPNEISPSGKFANLQAIILAVRPALSENGLCFYQYIELLDEGSGAALLISMVAHESGQYISSVARVVKGKNERQSGNILEHQKRIHAAMLLGIAPSKNDPIAFDDNGEELAEEQLINEVRKPKKAATKKTEEFETINNNQYQELLIELDGYESVAQDMMHTYGIDTLADLPKEEYHKARAKILKIKRIQEEYEMRRSRE